MAVKDGLPATDFSRMNREYIRNVAEGNEVPDGLPATDFSRMNREYIKAVVEEAGGGDITVEALSVTENNTYTAPEGKAYSPVTVNVPPPASIVDYVRVTPAAEINNSNKLRLTLTPTNNYVVVALPVDPVAVPETGQYRALGFYDAKYVSVALSGAILRSDGTQGTDGGGIGYTPATGELVLGSTYTIIPAGKTFDIYLMEHGGIAT